MAVLVVAGLLASVVWLDTNPVTAATVAYTVLTALLVIDSRSTRNVMREQIKQDEDARRAADRPLVLAYFERHENRVLFTVRNVGPAPASKLTFFLDQPISSAINPDFQNLSLLRNGMHTVPPGFSTTISFDWFREYVSDKHKQAYREAHGRELPFVYTGRIQYLHALAEGRSFSEPLILDLQYLEGQAWFTEKRTHHVAEELTRIRRVMESTKRTTDYAVNILDQRFGSHPELGNEEQQPQISEEKMQQIIEDLEGDPQF